LGIWGRRKVFFFEKKKQKTFGRLSRTHPAAYAKSQKFFGSFFQKRTLPSLKHLLITYHSTTGGTRAMAEAAHRAAAQEPGLTVTLQHAVETNADHLLAADGYIFATPETLAAIAGPMKDFFDRTYYAALGRIEGRPYAALICAGSDGANAARQIARIATGWRLKQVVDPVIVCTHAQTPEAILARKTLAATDQERCAELGATMAAGLTMGIF
jgi:multimeric flavodoxin WrbA